MKSSVILAIDQGTTGTRAILYDREGVPHSSAYQEFTQHYPRPGWVEHNPLEIWHSVQAVVGKAIAQARLKATAIHAIGITNQRETTLLWDRLSGKPVHPAIVWQDRRSASFCEALKRRGAEPLFRDCTGLVLDPYFSGTKIAWMLHHIVGLRRKARLGHLLFGTIDTWIIWNLTGGKSHSTDLTNASRTLILNIKKKCWDDELMRNLDIPKSILPEVMESGAVFGETVQQGPFVKGIPIHAVMGDQQAALYGQGCYRKGDSKNTYGTGCFIMTNLGEVFRRPPFGLLATLACNERGHSVYALEGAIFIAGAAIQWLRDGLGFFEHARESEAMAKSVRDSGGVTVIPALTGLGSPYWNPHVRGMITGLTRGTKREHLVRAALESLGHQTADVMDLMNRYSGGVHALKVDGGATSNRFLMQFQADILGTPILVSDMAESTAWGVAKLAALKSGFWPSLQKVDRRRKYQCFRPRLASSQRKKLRQVWQREMARLLK